MTADRAALAQHVIRWQRQHGRHDLPWQGTRDPYRVWLSEIMLQQTQVSTVLDYFPRFLARFPDVAAGPAPPPDEVLALWSGLGYYSRARNLHRCAQDVLARHAGEFPRSAELLQTLPGIGRSTAAAIAAFCFGERAAILDGNVKRVLTRVLGFDGDLAVASQERQLWQIAEELLPTRDLVHSMPAYTQGLMDLGATLCSGRKPECERCPLRTDCVASRQGEPERFPVRTRKLKRRSESWWLLVARHPQHGVWLQRRPDRGIWAGLYCVPVYDSLESLQQAVAARYHSRLVEGEALLHVLTHRDLYLHPVLADLPPAALAELAGDWVALPDLPATGLPAPIRKLLQPQ